LPWACPEDSYVPGNYNTYPYNISSWTNYIGFVAKQFKSNASIGAYEIYNEPNIEKYWCVNPELFANLTVEAAMTIKGIDPNATVLGPGLSQDGLNDPRVPDSGHVDPQFLVTWMNDANALARAAGYSNGFGSLFDGVCMHPYGTWQSQVANYQAVEAYLVKQSTRFDGKKFIIDNSETGYNTVDPDTLPSAQAQDIAKSMFASQFMGLNVFIVYEYRDGSSLPANYSTATPVNLNGDDFDGLVYANRTVKPSYYAFATVANLLNNGTLLTPWGTDYTNPVSASPSQGEITQGAFKTQNGSVVLVLWRDGAGIGTTSVLLKFTGTPITSDARVMAFSPDSWAAKSWVSAPVAPSTVQVHGNTLDLSNVPLGQNVTILEIANSSALQSYTITMPASFDAIILAPVLVFGLSVAIVVLSLLQKQRQH
jgi:hypothetical protein